MEKPLSTPIRSVFIPIYGTIIGKFITTRVFVIPIVLENEQGEKHIIQYN